MLKIENDSLKLAIAIAIIILSVGGSFFLIDVANAEYAGSCYEYGDGLYNATSITIVPVGETPLIEGLNEWYFADEQYEFTLINGTLTTTTTITDLPTTICTHPELAPGIYHITITGYTGYQQEEVQHYRGGGGDSGGDCSDKDGDGIPDNIEWFMCTDWTNPDTDGDGINDFEETVAGEDGWITDPCDADTDGDGVNDGDDPCPTDPQDECVMNMGGAPTQTMTPTATETPVATPTPDEPGGISWMLFAGLLGVCGMIIVFSEWYTRKKNH